MNDGLAWLGALIVLCMVLLALFAPYIAPYDPNRISAEMRLSPPSAQHPLGTDDMGRDLLSRVLHGGRLSLSIVVIAQGLSTVLGISLGLVAGWYSGWPDSVIMRLADALFAMPGLMFLIVWVAVLDSSLVSIFIGLGVISWPAQARLIRGHVLSLKERDYIHAARLIGMSDARILWRHVLPNALGTSFVLMALGTGGMILTEASLSFLGLGVPIPQASWGRLIYEGGQQATVAWWPAVLPGAVVMLTIIGFNLMGDGLQQALRRRP